MDKKTCYMILINNRGENFNLDSALNILNSLNANTRYYHIGSEKCLLGKK